MSVPTATLPSYLRPSPPPTLPVPSRDVPNVSYIPTKSAAKHLSRVTSDFESFQSAASSTTSTLVSATASLSEYYESVLSETKKRALAVIDYNKAKTEEANTKLSELREEMAAAVKNLESTVRQKQIEMDGVLVERIAEEQRIADLQEELEQLKAAKAQENTQAALLAVRKDYAAVFARSMSEQNMEHAAALALAPDRPHDDEKPTSSPAPAPAPAPTTTTTTLLRVSLASLKEPITNVVRQFHAISALSPPPTTTSILDDIQPLIDQQVKAIDDKLALDNNNNNNNNDAAVPQPQQLGSIASASPASSPEVQSALARALASRKKNMKIFASLAQAMKESDDCRATMTEESQSLSDRLQSTLNELKSFTMSSTKDKARLEEKIVSLMNDVRDTREKSREMEERLKEFNEKSEISIVSMQKELDAALEACQVHEVVRIKVEQRLQEVEHLRRQEHLRAAATLAVLKKERSTPSKPSQLSVTDPPQITDDEELRALRTKNEDLVKLLAEARNAALIAEQKAQAANAALVAEQRAQMVMAPVIAALGGGKQPSNTTSDLVAPTSAVDELKDKLGSTSAEVKSVDSERKSLKDSIKDWLSDFEQKNGRKVTDDDKSAIMGRYVELKDLEERLKDLKEQEKDLKQQVKALKKAEVEASAQATEQQSIAQPSTFFAAAFVDDSASTPQVAAQAQLTNPSAASLDEVKEKLGSTSAELKTVDNARKAVKDSIKDWLSNFEQTNGRLPTDEDKETINGRYVELKDLDDRVKVLKEQEKDLKQQVKALKAEIEAGAATYVPTTLATDIQQQEQSTLQPVPLRLTRDTEISESQFFSQQAKLTETVEMLQKANEDLEKQIAIKVGQIAAEKDYFKFQTEKVELTVKTLEEKSAAQSASLDDLTLHLKTSNLKLAEAKVELDAAKKSVESASARLKEAVKNGDEVLKHDAEEAHKEALKYKEAMVEAQTAEKVTKQKAEEFKYRAEHAESSLKELMENAPKSSVEEVNSLRKKMILRF